MIDILFGDGDSTDRQRKIRKRVIVALWAAVWLIAVWRQVHG